MELTKKGKPRQRKAPTNTKIWSTEEDDFLLRVYEDEQYTIAEIAEAIDRSESAVVKRARERHGLSRKKFISYDVETKPGYKKCSCCKEELPFEAFKKDSTKKLGIHASCRACVKLRRLNKAKEKAQKEKQLKKPTKACVTCGTVLPNTEEHFIWYKNTTSFANTCRKCLNEINYERQLENIREKGHK